MPKQMKTNINKNRIEHGIIECAIKGIFKCAIKGIFKCAIKKREITLVLIAL